MSNPITTSMLICNMGRMSALFMGVSLAAILISGCRTPEPHADESHLYFQDYLTEIQYPEIDDPSFESAQEALAGRPPSVSEFQQLDFQELSLEEAIQMALSNSKILSKIGGQVVSAPGAAISVFDPAVQETSPIGGVEGALSAFDVQWNTVFNFNRSEQKFNNPFLGGGSSQLVTNASSFVTGISKQTAHGATFGLSKNINYNRNNAPINRFPSSYDMIVRAEFRQALLRGNGSLVNQVAGPNSTPGLYNGVLIAKINQDLSLSDFELAVLNLVTE
ncbi:MAG: hypothetical protein VX438_12375, partial [Planctomycetota bacterium]|nr:hypothetical protein [Planctomycetota bacterium]